MVPSRDAPKQSQGLVVFLNKGSGLVCEAQKKTTEPKLVALKVLYGHR